MPFLNQSTDNHDNDVNHVNHDNDVNDGKDQGQIFLNRRDILSLLARIGGMGIAGAAASIIGAPRMMQSGMEAAAQQFLPSLDRLPADERLLIFLPQGGLDGLHFLSPYGDPDYRALRGELALSNIHNEAFGVPLDGLFALHPSVSHSLFDLWDQKLLSFMPAIASPYRGDDHFNARLVMQSGNDGNQHAQSEETGWLGRALSGVGQQMPQLIQPDRAYLDKTHQIKANVNGRISNGQFEGDQGWLSYEARAARAAAQDFELNTAMRGLFDYENERLNLLPITHDMGILNHIHSQGLVSAVKQIVPSMLHDQGPRIAIFAVNGFDSHIQQGTQQGTLAMNMANLAEAIRLAADSLMPIFHKTTILMISEFGRAIIPNAQGGTNHGNAGLALVVGGRVNGGQMIGPWPGLQASVDIAISQNRNPQLEKNRDGIGLHPTLDSRALFKSLLASVWNFDSDALNAIFPDSQNIPPIPNLFHSAA
ncbi:MAG: DUF1501 domain-containing protein [Alphaproteobacteria bacterium]